MFNCGFPVVAFAKAPRNNVAEGFFMMSHAVRTNVRSTGKAVSKFVSVSSLVTVRAFD